MESLPVEIIDHILSYLSPTDVLNCAIASSRMFRIVGRLLAGLTSLNISLSDCPTIGGVQLKDGWLSICQCGKHGSDEVLRNLFPVLTNDVNSLEVEDDLVNNRVTDEQMSILLAFCSTALKRLTLTRCDLMNVQPWTLALLAKFDQLEKLEMEGCTFSVSESLLIRSLSMSFKTLKNIDIRDNKQITDKFTRTVSRSCPHLESFRVSGCPSISTFSVLSLIESTFYRIPHELVVHMDGTPFSAHQLSMYMNSPLFANSDDWRLQPAYISIGYEKPAVLAEHKARRCLLIYV